MSALVAQVRGRWEGDGGCSNCKCRRKWRKLGQSLLSELLLELTVMTLRVTSSDSSPFPSQVQALEEALEATQRRLQFEQGLATQEIDRLKRKVEAQQQVRGWRWGWLSHGAAAGEGVGAMASVLVTRNSW